jgi:D-sedoheptulose 7-phosphate isomerase
VTEKWLRAYIGTHAKLAEKLDLGAVGRVISILADARRKNRTIFVCGNGGSAATASHLAVDLAKSPAVPEAGAKRFKVMSLVDNAAWTTALANDSGYESVFREKLANLASSGDVLVALSVSGTSPNVIEAVRYANANGVTTVALTSARGGELARLADHVLAAGTDHVGQCEDVHALVCHLVGYAFIENANV